MAILIEGERKEAPNRSAYTASIPLGLTTDRGEAKVLVRDVPARLSDVAPVAQALASNLSSDACSRQEAGGDSVTCGKGCGACCKYLVPLSVPEAFRLAEDIEAMEEPRRDRVWAAFDTAAERIVRAEGPPLASDGSRNAPDAPDACHAAGQWYSRLDLPCPLLAENVCSFYAARPVACREHLVTSAPKDCRGFQPGRGRAVDVPVSLVEALGRLAARMEAQPLEAVVLPVALHWAKLHISRHQRTWPARELFSRFAEIVTDMAHAAGIAAAAA